MIRRCRVPQSALLAAWQLGRRMACSDRRVRPCLRDVRHYRTFAQFRHAHRSLLDNTRALVPWDQRLQRLAESEAWWLGFHLDKGVGAWDAFHIFVMAPMREAFWRGWETHTRLESLYLARRKAILQRESQQQEPHVVRMKDLLPALPDLTEKMSETQRWESLAEHLFGGAAAEEVDDDFWVMPNPPTFGLPTRVRRHKPSVGLDDVRYADHQ